MHEIITLGDIDIHVTRKAIKNVHLSVHPPDGRVTLSAPTEARLEVARSYAISKLGWIRAQQDRLRNQPRETAREYVERESHYVWGLRYLMSVEYRDEKPSVKLDHRRIVLSVRPGSEKEQRESVMQHWYRALLHDAVPPIIKRWEKRLGVKVRSYHLQRMKTKWGSCNPELCSVRFNTELAKKPRDHLEYVVLHEMLHLIEPSHNNRFVSLLGEHLPGWRETRAELNELPLTALEWRL